MCCCIFTPLNLECSYDVDTIIDGEAVGFKLRDETSLYVDFIFCNIVGTDIKFLEIFEYVLFFQMFIYNFVCFLDLL